MHFENIDEAVTAADPTLLRDKEGADCVKGCYRCLLSYYNQPDHELIDRTNVEARKLLLRLACSAVEQAGGTRTSAKVLGRMRWRVGIFPRPTSSRSWSETSLFRSCGVPTSLQGRSVQLARLTARRSGQRDLRSSICRRAGRRRAGESRLHC